jgi:signal transduction histidine kinase
MAADDDDLVKRWPREAAGDVAVDVAAELAAPLASLRDRLALLVDRIDRHVAYQTGPEPYPWKQLQALRQDLAAGYLQLTHMAQLAVDLAHTVDALGAPAVEIDDVEHHVEAAVHLARHRIGARTELLVDAGHVSPIRAPVGELTLAVARMIAACAASAELVEKASLSVRCREEDGAWIVVSTADNGAGAPELAARLAATLTPFAQTLGGSFDGSSEAGKGSWFELRIPVAPQADESDEIPPAG